MGVARLEQLWRGLDGRDGACPSGWMPTAVQLARRGVAIHDNDGLRGARSRGCCAVERFEELRRPVPVRGHRHRRGPGGVVLDRPARRADPGVGGAAGRLPAGRDRRRPLPRRRHRQRRADLAGRRARRPTRSTCSTSARFDRPLPRAPAPARRRRAGVLDRPPPPLPPRPRRRCPTGVEAIVLPPGDPPRIRYNDFTPQRAS